MRLVALTGLVVFVSLSLLFAPALIVKAVMLIPEAPSGLLRAVTDAFRFIAAASLAYGVLKLWKVTTDRYFWRTIEKGRSSKP